jgi:two-component system, LuxR family, sensor kinase FixL
MIHARHQTEANPELVFRPGTWSFERMGSSLRTAFWVLLTGVCYYLATQIAWALCFPDSKVSLLFPPHAILVSVLLLTPTRHWWAYTLAAAGGHFFATQQAQWPFSYSLHCEVFDAAQNLLTAAGLRLFIKSPLKLITLRDAIAFVLIAVVIVPFGSAFWGAAFTISNGFGTHYWIEWRNLGISNGVTAVVLIPAILYALRWVSTRRVKVIPSRLLEAAILGVGIVVACAFAFDWVPAGPAASPALLYAPIPLLIWAAVRFGLGGVSVSMLFVTFQAIWGTMHGRGPFLAQTPAENVLALQLFLLMAGTPTMLLAVGIENGERSRRSLHESEAQNRGIINSLTSLVVVLDRWGYIVAANDAWRISYRLGGAAPPGIDIGVNYLEVCCRAADAGDRPSLDAVHGIEGVLSGTKKEFHVEYTCVAPAGTRWFEMLVLPLLSDAGGAVVSHRDITDRKLAELEAQQHRDELSRLSRVTMLGELSGSLAHELNQPLGAILINGQAAERMLERETPDLDALREVVHDIVSDDRRARDVIDRLRLLYRKGEGVWQSLDLNEVIDDTVRLARGNLARQHVELQTEYPPDLPFVTGDRVQLQQVLLNLLTNAIHAMDRVAPVDRRILVRTGHATAGFVSVSVTDCGCGIPPENLDRIFQSFFTTQSEGSGLGLTVCRTIIAAHRGSIVAENNAGAGATFRFTLPVISEVTA